MVRLLLFLLFVGNALAADYYVDYVGGSDSNDGSSTSLPFKHSPGDPRATGNAASTSLVAGDNVYFKGGVVYVTDDAATSIATSGLTGTSGNVITFDGNSAGTWGTGKAIIGDSRGHGRVAIGTSTGMDYVTIKNFIFRNHGGFATDDPLWDGLDVTSIDTGTDELTFGSAHGWNVNDILIFSTTNTAPSGMSAAVIAPGLEFATSYLVESVVDTTTITLKTSGGSSVDLTDTGTGTLTAWYTYGASGANEAPNGGDAIFAYLSSNITIEDCDFLRIGTYQTTPPLYGTEGTKGRGITLEDVSDITITNCTFEDIEVPISLKASTGNVDGITIADCTFTGMIRWGIDIAPQTTGRTFQNITIADNEWYNYNEVDETFWTGFGDAPHRNGIFVRHGSIASTAWTNNVIERCLFRGALNSSGGTASIFFSKGGGFMIRNCLFLWDSMSNAAINIGFDPLPGNTLDIKIYNCTAIGNEVAYNVENEVDPGESVILVNCASFRLNATRNILNVDFNRDGTGTEVLDYLVFGSYYTPEVDDQVIGPGTWTAADYEAISASTFLRMLESDLSDFVSVDGVQANTASWDPTPASGSIMLNNGDDLSSEGFTDDFYGNPRPAGMWDIGAIQVTVVSGSAYTGRLRFDGAGSQPVLTDQSGSVPIKTN